MAIELCVYRIVVIFASVIVNVLVGSLDGSGVVLVSWKEWAGAFGGVRPAMGGSRKGRLHRMHNVRRKGCRLHVLGLIGIRCILGDGKEKGCRLCVLGLMGMGCILGGGKNRTKIENRIKRKRRSEYEDEQ